MKYLQILSICTGILTTTSIPLVAEEVEPTPAMDLKEPPMVIIHGPISIPVLADPRNVVPDHLEAFGFYQSGWEKDDIPDAAKLSTFVNIDYGKVDTYMDVAKSSGTKVWISLQSIFFSGYDDGYKKNDDYYESWLEAKEKLKPYEDMIYAFDPLDEPYHRSDMDNDDLKEYLEEIGLLLKADFPNARRGITFTKDTVGEMKSKYKGECVRICSRLPAPPNNYDLFGADYYKHKNFQSDVVNDLMYATQDMDVKYHIVPRAFKTDSPSYSVMTEEELVLRAWDAYDFAASNEKIVTIFPFVWRTAGNNEHDEYSYYGVKTLPLVRSQYEILGKAVAMFRD
ncbi:hypothetical protein [Microbulbifer sp. ZKSA002]|uniref:hypothetical protein n=1 Tax=Microbulbifer sp. ZKSA002 TaxID=3243388 RepID=UPI00403A7866